MLKASSLYMVIVISLVIAVMTASLISVAYFYRYEYQKNLRYSHLAANLESGTAILLSQDFTEYDSVKVLDLFGEGADSVLLHRESWGLYDLAIAKAFVLTDTVKKAFLIAKDNSADHAAIYLSDEDRPLSVSGNTQITGDGILPKSGIKGAYVDGKPFRSRKLLNGTVKTSTRKLPALSSQVLEKLSKMLETDSLQVDDKLTGSVRRSFFEPAVTYDLSGSIYDLTDISLEGKIILVSDTTIRISRTASLKDVMIYAPAILVEEGFRGNCQLFARDSIVAGKDVVFEYPSVMGVLKPDGGKAQARMGLGEGGRFSGILFTYEKSRSDLQTIINLGKNSHIRGEVYATGLIKLDRQVRIDGKVSCNRFIMQTPATLFENYLIDVIINRPARSKYYVSSGLFSPDNVPNRILKWLR